MAATGAKASGRGRSGGASGGGEEQLFTGGERQMKMGRLSYGAKIAGAIFVIRQQMVALGARGRGQGTGARLVQCRDQIQPITQPMRIVVITNFGLHP